MNIQYLIYMIMNIRSIMIASATHNTVVKQNLKLLKKYKFFNMREKYNIGDMVVVNPYKTIGQEEFILCVVTSMYEHINNFIRTHNESCDTCKMRIINEQCKHKYCSLTSRRLHLDRVYDKQ